MENVSITAESSVGHPCASTLSSVSGTEYAVLVLHFILTHL